MNRADATILCHVHESTREDGTCVTIGQLAFMGVNVTLTCHGDGELFTVYLDSDATRRPLGHTTLYDIPQPDANK